MQVDHHLQRPESPADTTYFSSNILERSWTDQWKTNEKDILNKANPEVRLAML